MSKETWCVTDCGMTICRYNKIHCKEPESSRHYMFMKGVTSLHCAGYKAPKKEGKKNGKTNRRKQTGKKLQKR